MRDLIQSNQVKLAASFSLYQSLHRQALKCCEVTSEDNTFSRIGMERMLKNAARIHSTDFKVTKNSSYEANIFRDIRWRKSFVDKTLWLRDYWEFGEEHLYLTAPPKFGKTTLLHMMREFFDRHAEVDVKSPLGLFNGTEILKQEPDFFHSHFRRGSVLFLDFADLANATDRDSFRRMLCAIYGKAREEKIRHRRLKTPQERETEVGAFIEKCATNFTGTVECIDMFTQHLYFQDNNTALIVLINDVDSVAHALLKHNVDYKMAEAVMDDLDKFLDGLLKDNWFVKRSVLVGSLVFGVEPPPRNIGRVPYLWNELYAQYVGLTEEEVGDLLVKFGEPKDKLTELRDYYGGYAVRKSEMLLLNTVSVLGYLASRKLDYYWLPSVEPTMHNRAVLSRPSIGACIEKLIIGEGIPPHRDIFLDALDARASQFKAFRQMRDGAILGSRDEEKGKNGFLFYLEDTGYLIRHGSDPSQLFLANKEVKYGLGKALVRDSSYYKNAYNLTDNIREDYVNAFMGLRVDKPQLPVQRLAKAFHRTFSTRASSSADSESIYSFGGPLWTWLAYSSDTGFKEVHAQQRIDWKTFKVQRTGLAAVRNDGLCILIELKKDNSSLHAMRQLLDDQSYLIFQQKLGVGNLNSQIFVGINVDSNCSVRISYNTTSHRTIRDVQYPP